MFPQCLLWTRGSQPSPLGGPCRSLPSFDAKWHKVPSLGKDTISCACRALMTFCCCFLLSQSTQVETVPAQSRGGNFQLKLNVPRIILVFIQYFQSKMGLHSSKINFKLGTSNPQSSGKQSPWTFQIYECLSPQVIFSNFTECEAVLLITGLMLHLLPSKQR